MSFQGTKEKLLGWLPVSGQTLGENIANSVVKSLKDSGINLNKTVFIITDGARSMTGIHRVATLILQKKINHKILTFHCIIYQEVLCAQTFMAKIVEFTNLIKIINNILAKEIFHLQFIDLLETIDSLYSDLLLHNIV